ncbi:MAG: hypothetical protein F6J87_03180 [Spirulina sp. SIO3F2]|nr:hypothetical protein [Spirulina sp. SIO3F2]
MPRYRLYGYEVESNQAIAALTPQTELDAPVDIEILLGQTIWDLTPTPSQCWYTSPHNHLQVWHWPQEQLFWFRYQDDCQFWLQRQPARIWATWPTHTTLEDALTYLLGPVFAFMVRLLGQVCLHASAVCLPQGTVAFLGPAGAGKSTTAAILAQQGYPVLTDDVVVLQEQAGQFNVMPGYPRLRLWPMSTELLYGDPQALPRWVPEHPTWNKQYLDLRQSSLSFAAAPEPLSRIYCLGTRSPNSQSYCSPLSAQAAWRSIIANTSVNYLLDRQLRRQEFEILGRLVNCIPGYQLHVTREPHHFAELLQCL